MSLLSVRALFLFAEWYALGKTGRIVQIYFSAKECESVVQRRREDQPLSAPNADGNVWPNQVCPAYEPRFDTPDGLRQCWYCRYADFHLDKPRALDVGICCWPKKIIK